MIDDAAIANPDDNQSDWVTDGGNYQEGCYVQLDQIHESNINELGLAWTNNLVGSKRGLQSTPLALDGIIFFT